MKSILHKIFRKYRVLLYKLLSDNNNVSGKPFYIQAALMNGKGQIKFDDNVHLGYNPSPYLYSGYIYIEARHESAKIDIGKNVWINNNSVLISEREGIVIGNNVLIGTNVEIIDSNFHVIDKRNEKVPKSCKVIIEDNVFIGSNVKILKGVHLKNNTVVANGSVVTKSFPDNVVIGGNPAKIIQNR